MSFLLKDDRVPSTDSAAFLTLSIDDGHPTDLKTAELVANFGLRATFYVPASNRERPVMSVAEIRELSAIFEIGSHTLNHRRVNRLSDSEARIEIDDGKKWLEDVLSQEVVSFCYPGGKFNQRTGQIVKDAGFLGARTCRVNTYSAPADPFHWGVTTQAYTHGVLKSLRMNSLAGSMNQLRICGLAHDWETHFVRSLDWVEGKGGIAHLYIHSWETDMLGEWNKLKRVLANAASRKRLIRVSNGDLFAKWHKGQKQVDECVQDATSR
jgi:peptidoglycan/xylan/chitin deacetylase (PgdA/CDA1 family)